MLLQVSSSYCSPEQIRTTVSPTLTGASFPLDDWVILVGILGFEPRRISPLVPKTSVASITPYPLFIIYKIFRRPRKSLYVKELKKLSHWYMKTGIKEVESKYFTDEKKGVTVCIISGYTNFLGYCEDFQVKGVSRCSKEDKFDAVTGRRLAEGRAKLKMFKEAEKRAGQSVEKLEKLVSDINAAKSVNVACQGIEQKHLSGLY